MIQFYWFIIGVQDVVSTLVLQISILIDLVQLLILRLRLFLGRQHRLDILGDCIDWRHLSSWTYSSKNVAGWLTSHNDRCDGGLINGGGIGDFGKLTNWLVFLWLARCDFLQIEAVKSLETQIYLICVLLQLLPQLYELSLQFFFSFTPLRQQLHTRHALLLFWDDFLHTFRELIHLFVNFRLLFWQLHDNFLKRLHFSHRLAKIWLDLTSEHTLCLSFNKTCV